MLIAVEGSETGDGIESPMFAEVVLDVEQGTTYVSLMPNCLPASRLAGLLGLLLPKAGLMLWKEVPG